MGSECGEAVEALDRLGPELAVEFKAQAREGAGEAGEHGEFKAFDIDLAEIGRTVLGDERIEGGDGDGLGIGKQILGGKTSAGGDVGAEGGDFGKSGGLVQRGGGRGGAERSAEHADRGGGETAMQPGDERGLGLDGEDAPADRSEEDGVVTDIGSDIEDE